VKMFHEYQRPPDPAAIERTLDRFADELADDRPLDDIARRLRLTRGSACAFLKMLHDRYDPQTD
jgi:hypothetical protein